MTKKTKKVKKNRARYIDTRTGKFVKESTWKRSKARGGTRYKRVVKRKPKEAKPEGKQFQLRYTIKPSSKKKNPFYGELIFTAPAGTSEEDATEIGATLLRGETPPQGVLFKSFNYSHRSPLEMNRTVLFDDLGDYEFLVYEDADAYLER